MRWKKTTIIISICVLSITFLATSAYAEWKPKIKYLIVYNGSLGGGWHAIATKTSDLIQKAIPELSTTSGPGGSIANAKHLQSGKGRLGMCLSGVSAQAYKGTGVFEKPCKNLRHVVSMYNRPAVWIVRKDSDITSFDQLGDKSIAPGKRNQGIWPMAVETFKAYGMDLESQRERGGVLHLLGDRERVNMLKDRHIDAMMLSAPLNHANFLDLKMMPGIRLLSIDKDKVKKVAESIPGTAVLKIPKGSFQPNQKEDVYALASVTTLICRDDVEDELIYRIARVVVENHNSYVGFVPSKDLVMHTEPLRANMIPVHPGAMRYFKEKGFVK